MTTSKKASDTLKRWTFGWIPLGLYSVSVFHRAILPPEEIPSFFYRFLNDKVMHGIEYFTLFLFAANAFRRAESNWLSSRYLIAAFYHTALMGIITEQAERFTVNRFCSLADFIADLAGSGLAWGMVILISRYRSLRHSESA